MDQTFLVTTGLDQGERFIHDLDAAGLGPSSAFWYFDSYREEWRLVLAFPPEQELDHPFRQKLLDVLTLRNDVDLLEMTARIRFMKADDPFERAFAKRKPPASGARA